MDVCHILSQFLRAFEISINKARTPTVSSIHICWHKLFVRMLLCGRSGAGAVMATTAVIAGLPRLAPARGRRRRCTVAAAMGASGLEEGKGKKTATVRSKASGDTLEVCRVVNGMWQVSGASWGRAAPAAAVDAMLAYADGGLATFDMADIYGPAEDLYGMFINKVRRERPPEMLEEVRGLTKWVPPPVKMTRSFVEENINRSRKRMDVAALDMLQFHWWDYANPGYLDALKHITDLKEEGKIKTVALTNFDTERLQIILENGIPIVSNQVQHSIVDMRPQKKMAELCELTGVKLITYGTVMGGLLSEKFLDTNINIPFAGPPLNTPSLQKYKRMIDAWGGWSLFQALLQTLKKVSLKHGIPISTVAVRYILNQTSVAGSMVGVRLGLSEHIRDTNAILSLLLDEEDMGSITEASQRGRNLMEVIGDCGDEYRA
ncbi:flagellar radial spoke protein 5-like isoform X1 [Triticum dicoccoides]|uniref:flagellar radial spoke protein 5-like isoform X1 n=1 Tax=Triticum dicoccoides TaxID=85692 RepID=UPI000E7BFA09|nr:flagellar radial spoke protein 5-like isoform X1 [Triticum dicoccoides]